jgi:hypothetical protein
MSQKDADKEFIEAITNFSKEIIEPASLLPMIINVAENVLEDKSFMDDADAERTLSDKDIAGIAFIVTNLVVQKFGKAICSMVDDGVIVPNADRAAELADEIREKEASELELEDDGEDDDEDDEDESGFGDWLKLG